MGTRLSPEGRGEWISLRDPAVQGLGRQVRQRRALKALPPPPPHKASPPPPNHKALLKKTFTKKAFWVAL